METIYFAGGCLWGVQAFIKREYISKRSDKERIVVEILPLTNYVKSADEHQDRLEKYPNDYCHIPKSILNKYKTNA